MSRTLPRSLVTVLLAAALLAAPAAAAQIVNVQPLMSGSGEGFNGEAHGSLTWKTGNVELLLAKANLLLSYQFGIHKIISSSQGELGIKSDESFLERVFSHLRHQASFGWGLTWETFGQIATDRFKRLALRGLAGTGIRYDIVEGPAVGFAVAAAYMFEREQLGTSDFADSGIAENNHVLSTYITGKFILAPMVTLIHTTYFQPKLTDPADFKISSETDLGFRLNDYLSISVGFDLGYVSNPPTSVDELDTSTTVSLGVTF